MECNICHGKGLIPFVKQGKVIPHVFVDCECKPFPSSEYIPLTPDMLDFPVSRDFYRYYCQRYHWPDPGKMQEDKTVIHEITKLQGILPVVIQAKQNRKPSNNKGIEL